MAQINGVDIKVLDGYILLEPFNRADERESTIEGFQFANPDFQGVPHTGKVVAVCEGDHEVKEGQVVVFKEDHPKGFELFGKKLFRVKLDQILAVVEDHRKGE